MRSYTVKFLDLNAEKGGLESTALIFDFEMVYSMPTKTCSASESDTCNCRFAYLYLLELTLMVMEAPIGTESKLK